MTFSNYIDYKLTEMHKTIQTELETFITSANDLFLVSLRVSCFGLTLGPIEQELIIWTLDIDKLLAHNICQQCPSNLINSLVGQ